MGLKRMRRRVLHARIRASVVYACFQIQRERGMHPERKPVSTVVAEVLEAMITTLARRGDVSVLSDDEADVEISKWLSEVGDDKSFDMGLSLDSLEFSGSDDPPAGFGGLDPDDDLDDEVLPDTDQAYDIGREIVKTITGIASQPRNLDELFRQEAAGEEQEQEIPLSAIPPWEQEGILSIEYIKAEVKKTDEVAEGCLLGNETSQRALQVVYSNIPRELWGTSRAKSLILKVIPTVERHLAKNA